MSSSCRERGELLVPVKDRDGRGVPAPDSSPQHLSHAVGSHSIPGDRTLPSPCCPWDMFRTSHPPHPPHKDWPCFSPLMAAAEPMHSLHHGHCDSDTTVTVLLSPGASLCPVPTARVLWFCCKHQEPQKSQEQAAWQAVAPQPPRPPPCTAETGRKVSLLPQRNARR